jgi:branched-subunit amino acid permease
VASAAVVFGEMVVGTLLRRGVGRAKKLVRDVAEQSRVLSFLFHVIAVSEACLAACHCHRADLLGLIF